MISSTSIAPSDFKEVDSSLERSEDIRFHCINPYGCTIPGIGKVFGEGELSGGIYFSFGGKMVREGIMTEGNYYFDGTHYNNFEGTINGIEVIDGTEIIALPSGFRGRTIKPKAAIVNGVRIESGYFSYPPTDYKNDIIIEPDPEQGPYAVVVLQDDGKERKIQVDGRSEVNSNGDIVTADRVISETESGIVGVKNNEEGELSLNLFSGMLKCEDCDVSHFDSEHGSTSNLHVKNSEILGLEFNVDVPGIFTQQPSGVDGSVFYEDVDLDVQIEPSRIGVDQIQLLFKGKIGEFVRSFAGRTVEISASPNVESFINGIGGSEGHSGHHIREHTMPGIGEEPFTYSTTLALQEEEGTTQLVVLEDAEGNKHSSHLEVEKETHRIVHTTEMYEEKNTIRFIKSLSQVGLNILTRENTKVIVAQKYSIDLDHFSRDNLVAMVYGQIKEGTWNAGIDIDGGDKTVMGMWKKGPHDVTVTANFGSVESLEAEYRRVFKNGGELTFFGRFSDEKAHKESEEMEEHGGIDDVHRREDILHDGPIALDHPDAPNWVAGFYYKYVFRNK